MISFILWKMMKNLRLKRFLEILIFSLTSYSSINELENFPKLGRHSDCCTFKNLSLEIASSDKNYEVNHLEI